MCLHAGSVTATNANNHDQRRFIPAPTFPCRRCDTPVFVDKLLCSSCNHRRAVARLEVTTSIQPWLNALGKMIRKEVKKDPRSQVQVQMSPFPWEFMRTLHSYLQELPDGRLVTPLLQTKGRLGGKTAQWSCQVNSALTMEQFLAPYFPETMDFSRTLTYYRDVRIAAYPSTPLVLEWEHERGKEMATILKCTFDICVMYESGKFGWPDEEFDDETKSIIRRRIARLILAVDGQRLPQEMLKKARALVASG